MEPRVINCAHCGTPFEQKRTAIYCSRRCRYEGTLLARPKRTCEQCGADYHPHWGAQRYCSRLCGARATAPLRSAAYRRLPDRKCETCGKMLRPRSAQTRFCSRECYYASTGGRYAAGGGYVRVKVPKGTPNAGAQGRMLEHRYVMQQHLGRPLTADEVVHHINGVRDDNRIENLQLVRSHHGKGARYVCLDCGSHNVEAVERGR